MLFKLLNKLQDQVTENLFTYSAVVVDNDADQSGRETVKDWKDKSEIQIDYYCEPEKNIALARNKAVENAKGNFIAFIDDDEFPVNTWLLNLFKTYNAYKCTGVLGPVKPHFEKAPPEWIVKGNFCERPSHITGSILRHSDTRTGNVLLSRKIFEDENNRFGAEFGRTGGEDIEFFYRRIGEGHIFIWCHEAPVYETVPPERWQKSFYLKKYLRMGGLTGEKFRSISASGFKYFAKITAALCFYALATPFSFLFGQHQYMKCLTKDLYYIGCISGFLGYVPIRNRES